MGYTGGKREGPKDYKPYDHTHAILIEYNPSEISYRSILELWHDMDDPWHEEKRRYRSAVFWKTLSQQDTAISYIHEIQATNPSEKLHTDIERAHKFYEVEQYDDVVINSSSHSTGNNGSSPSKNGTPSKP